MAATPGSSLRAALVWDETVLDDRNFPIGTPIKVGEAGDATFVIPGVPAHILLSTDGKTARLRTTSGMRGFVWQGTDRQVLPSEPAEIALLPGARGIVVFDATAESAVYFQYDPPVAQPPLAAPSRADKFFTQAIIFSLLCHGIVLGLAYSQWEPNNSLDLDPPPTQKIAKLVMEQAEEKQKQEKGKQAGELRRVRERDTSKRAEKKEGKVGAKDAKREETIIPKGERDRIAAKVADVGLLGAMKGTKGNALSKLLSDSDSDVTEALRGVRGAQLAIGQGAGGMSTRGDGAGGGGKGKGQLFGVGNLATGAGAGARPGLDGGQGGRVAKEMKVGVSMGNATTEGGLTKEQVNQVVQQHKAAIQFCYEKELQRFPNLAGKVDLYWVVGVDGRVGTSKVAATTLGNPSAESCMVRTVRSWQFPKSSGQTIVNPYPFFFRGH